jgi:acetyl-CoA carboxylase beta subunit
MAEAVSDASAVSGATADHRVRSEAEAEWVTDEEVTNGSPFRVVAAAADELLNAETDVFGEEVVDSETTTPEGTAGIVEGASSEGVNLKLLVTEFAFRGWSDGFFEGLRGGACEGASDGDSNCNECDCEFFHMWFFVFGHLGLAK